jgi:hypothetical protein
MKRKRRQPQCIDESRYAGKWLALHPETLAFVADGETLHEALENAATKGVTDPVMHAVPESSAYFIGAGDSIIRS